MSHIITVLLSVGMLGMLLVALWLLESNPGAMSEEQQTRDIFE